ncbi:MAG TPA: bifunctional diaminohydroxyphosphoribosylaminopyrimidine deaminase/5-amino-6-(5-phosphoribosylamino)uracil reductase RibD [Actinomycetota bacterium]|nr:bifunctional diaminohydroxyphosphoribosylaminopyrimidine deaminase/5-amino-6-(5-phosphoribosylamino)uracil reductase RibD [Actinomycetota bacterium]
MDGHDTDVSHMREALALAERGWGHVSPNPMVGAVVLVEGQIVGRGWYEGPSGSPHAEVRALREAGDLARGATVVCTLEPCNHHGATPPCTDALLDAGVARVIVGATDPNPLVDGSGIARLRTAGLEVRDGVLAEEARRVNAAFDRHVTTGMPFVIWKVATSLDGKTAAHDGSSRWITSEESRLDAHRLRAWADAVVVGAGTVAADDPSLTARHPDLASAWAPLRVVVDASGRVAPEARVFDDEAPTLVATTVAGEPALSRALPPGIDVAVCPADASGGVSPRALLEELGKRDVQGVLLEGGATLAWSFVRDGAVDRIVQYVAPRVVGGADAPSAVMGEGFAPIDAALDLSFVGLERVGPDIRMEADVHRHR